MIVANFYAHNLHHIHQVHLLLYKFTMIEGRKYTRVCVCSILHVVFTDKVLRLTLISVKYSF